MRRHAVGSASHSALKNFMGFKVMSLSVLLTLEFMEYCYKCAGGGGGGFLFGLCLVYIAHNHKKVVNNTKLLLVQRKYEIISTCVHFLTL